MQGVDSHWRKKLWLLCFESQQTNLAQKDVSVCLQTIFTHVCCLLFVIRGKFFICVFLWCWKFQFQFLIRRDCRNWNDLTCFLLLQFRRERLVVYTLELLRFFWVDVRKQVLCRCYKKICHIVLFARSGAFLVHLWNESHPLQWIFFCCYIPTQCDKRASVFVSNIFLNAFCACES